MCVPLGRTSVRPEGRYRDNKGAPWRVLIKETYRYPPFIRRGRSTVKLLDVNCAESRILNSRLIKAIYGL